MSRSDTVKRNQKHAKENAAKVVQYLLKIPNRQMTMKAMQRDLNLTSEHISVACSVLVDAGAMEKEKVGMLTLVKLTNDKPVIE